MIKFDRHIFKQLLSITLFVLLVLICIFVLIDFSENSDEFAENGAEMGQIWNQYYLNYVTDVAPGNLCGLPDCDRTDDGTARNHCA